MEIFTVNRRVKCKRCGKGFMKTYEYVYKLPSARGMQYFCSWTCLQEHRKKLDKKKVK